MESARSVRAVHVHLWRGNPLVTFFHRTYHDISIPSGTASPVDPLSSAVSDGEYTSSLGKSGNGVTSGGHCWEGRRGNVAHLSVVWATFSATPHMISDTGISIHLGMHEFSQLDKRGAHDNA